MKIDNKTVNDLDEFKRVVSELEAIGNDEEEVVEILVADYRHLFRELTPEEIEETRLQAENAFVREVMADLNRESIANTGHPFTVGVRIDGEMVYRHYDSLSVEEIEDYKQKGLIL